MDENRFPWRRLTKLNELGGNKNNPRKYNWYTLIKEKHAGIKNAEMLELREREEIPRRIKKYIEQWKLKYS